MRGRGRILMLPVLHGTWKCAHASVKIGRLRDAGDPQSMFGIPASGRL
jgi:hypothetical protein